MRVDVYPSVRFTFHYPNAVSLGWFAQAQNVVVYGAGEAGAQICNRSEQAWTTGCAWLLMTTQNLWTEDFWPAHHEFC